MAALDLDILKRAVNVHWGGRDIVVLFGISGTPQFFLKFPTNRLPDAPQFGGKKNVPTDTKPVALTPLMPVNNTVVATAAFVTIDDKAYTAAHLQEWVGEVATRTGVIRYYDPEGEQISEDDVPTVAPGDKGKAIVSDQEGTVYAQKNGPGGDGRIYKLHREDETHELWTIDDGEPLTVNYDADTERIIAPGIKDLMTISFYDPVDGSSVSSKTLPHPIHDVSRKGKVYVFTDSEPFPDIKGFTREGAALFTISGGSGGMRFDSITAYGEDYIVVTARYPQSNEFSFTIISDDPILGVRTLTTQSSSIPIWLIVYDGNTGAQVSKTLWGNEVNTVNTDSLQPAPGNPPIFSSTVHGSYAGVVCLRNSYLPERSEEGTA